MNFFAASRLAVCDKAPSQWTVEEVVEFVRTSRLPENVADAFKGKRWVCVYAAVNAIHQ